MILTEKKSQNGESSNSSEKKHKPTSLISRINLFQRLRRSKEARARFVESHLDKSIAFQIRSLRDKEGWTQGVFAEKLGIKYQNNVSARLENPNYGKHSLTTLKKIAATCDVALVVWFIPFSRLLDWVTGTPHIDNGLSEEFYEIPNFGSEFGFEHLGSGAEQATAKKPPKHDFAAIQDDRDLGAAQAAYGD
jgi:transcriptional regulator with XRE-family HTH domain